MIELERLLTLVDDLPLSCISTAEGLRSYLSRHVEVARLREALKAGAVTFADLEAFMLALIAQFVPGTRNANDVVIAAVVVGIEPLPAAALQDFLEDLARVRIAEMPMAPRVARLSLRERAQGFAQLTTREFTISDLVPQACPIGEELPVKTEVGLNDVTLDLQQVA
jgi:hypothetical protein